MNEIVHGLEEQRGREREGEHYKRQLSLVTALDPLHQLTQNQHHTQIQIHCLTQT